MARGRKRKAGKRLPCGKRPREESQQEAMATVLEARQRHYGVTARQAKDERLGTALGRLAFAGLIDADQYAAGQIYGEVGTNFIGTSRINLYLNDGKTKLLADFTPGVLVWRGNDATNPTYWDTETTINWFNATTSSVDKFFPGDAVRFVAILGAAAFVGLLVARTE